MRCRIRAAGRTGFSTIELLVVITALAALAAIVLPKFMNTTTRGRESALKSDLKQIRGALANFNQDTGCYPLTIDDLTKSNAERVRAWNPSSSSRTSVHVRDWHGPYMVSIPNDPVSHSAYNYDSVTGNVTSAAPGIGLDGVPYNRW
jgi:general secretion pathway protein G